MTKAMLTIGSADPFTHREVSGGTFIARHWTEEEKDAYKRSLARYKRWSFLYEPWPPFGRLPGALARRFDVPRYAPSNSSTAILNNYFHDQTGTAIGIHLVEV